MIYIFEDKKKKLCGINSLFICFDFNQDILNIIKSSGVYDYDANTHMWEVPITSLAYLLDNLFYFDDIKLFVQDEEVENGQSETLKHPHRTKLYDYQKEGVEYFLNHNKGLLLDEPGLGKTLQMITLAEELKEEKDLKHCLVICGIASLRTNWKEEIRKHSYLDSMMVGARINRNGKLVWDSVAKRVEQLKNPIDEFFVIINVESLRDERIVDAINKGPNKFDMMVFDEMHKCKGWSSIQSNGLLELSSKYQVGMTGTLLLNSPLDAFIPLLWIGIEPKSKIKGKPGITRFKNMYCILDASVKGKVLGYKNLEILKDEIDYCSLRRTKDLLDLPSKNIITECLAMEGEEAKFYQTLEQATKEDYKQVAKELCDKVQLKTSNLLSLITRLRQATSCPSVLTSKNIVSCKLERAMSLVDEIVSNGDKVVIMSTFKEPVYQLEKLLQEYKPLIGTGDMKDGDISNNIRMFQEDDEHKVFIGTISKMGTGFTLTKASYMIFIDLPWTDGLYEQACDRIHRIGSKYPVFIYNLVCSDTIDMLTLEAIENKKALSDYVIDDKIDDNILTKLHNYLLEE